MNNSYLLMWLEGPLQAWGYDSKFGRRDTLKFPTKSGIMGLLCCAQGAGGEQIEFIQKMTSMNMIVFSYLKNNRHSESYSQPLLRDFQMIGSGYAEQDAWENLFIPRKGDGKIPGTGGSKLTYRYYLQDSTFAVILEIPDDIKGVLENALQNPIWDLYLGRKNCAPTDFIYRGVYASLDEAIENANKIAMEKSLVENFRVLDGRYENQGETMILNDVPIQFGQYKKYRDRYVTIVKM